MTTANPGVVPAYRKVKHYLPDGPGTKLSMEYLDLLEQEHATTWVLMLANGMEKLDPVDYVVYD